MVRQEITDLENRFWRTMIDKNVEATGTMLADRTIVTGSQGAAPIDNPSFARMMSDSR